MSSPTNLKEEKLAKDAAFFEFLSSNNRRPAAEEGFLDEEEQQIPKNSITKRAAAFAFTGQANNHNDGGPKAAPAAAAQEEEECEKKQMAIRANAHEQEEEEATENIPTISNCNSVDNPIPLQAVHQSPPGAFRIHRTGMVAAAVAEISASELSVVQTSTPTLRVSSTALRMSVSDALPAMVVPEKEQQQDSTSQKLEEVMDVVPIPMTHPAEGQRQWRQFTKSRTFNFGCLFLFLTAIVLGILFGLILPTSNGHVGSGSTQDLPPPTPETTEEHDPLYPPFDDDLEASTIAAIAKDPTSPAYKANAWMMEDPNLSSYPKWRQKQRFHLVNTYFSTQGEHWFHNDNWLSYEVSECQWWFRTKNPCNELGELIAQDLHSNNLNGTLPLEPPVGTLEYGDQSNNHLYGSIPPVFLYQSVEVVNMSNNNFSGMLVASGNFGVPKLREIQWANNQFEALPIGAALFLFPSLEILNFTGNRFGGELPTTWPHNHPLTYLGLGDNQYEGTIPTELGLLRSLQRLDLSGNSGITGSLPSEMAGLHNLTSLNIAGTSMTGVVPAGLCTRAEEEFTLVANCTQIQCCL